jgi:Carboxypeptidase regulatory-like domain
MRKLIAIVLGSGALLLGYPAISSSAEIVGRIANPAGVPIFGIMVSAQNQTGATDGAGVSDVTGKYAIDGLAPGIYTLMAKGQTAVVYVGDEGITVDWGIAANSQIIAAARKGTAPQSASVGGKSSMKDSAAKQVGAGSSERNDNAVQRGDCAEDDDDGEQNDDAEIATNVEPGAKSSGRRHCRHTESD